MFQKLFNQIKALCPSSFTVTQVPATSYFDDDKIRVDSGTNQMIIHVFFNSAVNTINKSLVPVLSNYCIDGAGYVEMPNGRFNFTVKDDDFKAMTFYKKVADLQSPVQTSPATFGQVYKESCIGGASSYGRNDLSHTLKSLIASL